MFEQNDVSSNWGKWHGLPPFGLLGDVSGDAAEGTSMVASACGRALGLDVEALRSGGGSFNCSPHTSHFGGNFHALSCTSSAQGSPFLHILADTWDHLSS